MTEKARGTPSVSSGTLARVPAPPAVNGRPFHGGGAGGSDYMFRSGLPSNLLYLFAVLVAAMVAHFLSKRWALRMLYTL